MCSIIFAYSWSPRPVVKHWGSPLLSLIRMCWCTWGIWDLSYLLPSTSVIKYKKLGLVLSLPVLEGAWAHYHQCQYKTIHQSQYPIACTLLFELSCFKSVIVPVEWVGTQNPSKGCRFFAIAIKPFKPETSMKWEPQAKVDNARLPPHLQILFPLLCFCPVLCLVVGGDEAQMFG